MSFRPSSAYSHDDCRALMDKIWTRSAPRPTDDVSAPLAAIHDASTAANESEDNTNTNKSHDNAPPSLGTVAPDTVVTDDSPNKSSEYDERETEFLSKALQLNDGLPLKLYAFDTADVDAVVYDSQATTKCGVNPIFKIDLKAARAAVTITLPKMESVRKITSRCLTQHAFETSLSLHKMHSLASVGLKLEVPPFALSACLDRAAKSSEEATAATTAMSRVAVHADTLVVPRYTMSIDPYALELLPTYVDELVEIGKLGEKSKMDQLAAAERFLRNYGAFFVQAQMSVGVAWSCVSYVQYKSSKQESSAIKLSMRTFGAVAAAGSDGGNGLVQLVQAAGDGKGSLKREVNTSERRTEDSG